MTTTNKTDIEYKIASIFSEEYYQFVLDSLHHSRLFHEKEVASLLYQFGSISDKKDGDSLCTAVLVAYATIVLVVSLEEDLDSRHDYN